MVEQVAKPDRARVVIEMWSDLGCPWCYVAKHRLEAAIGQRPDAERFEIVMRSFELYPAAPHEPEPVLDAFLRTHAATAAQFVEGERQLQAMARREGLEFSLDRLSANTFDLHRAVQYAGDQGRGYEFFSRVQDSYFHATLNPFEPDALAGVSESVGLDGQRVREILANDEYADRVRADRAEGQALGATGVPFVVLDRRVAASGAQKVPVYGRLLDQVTGRVPSERVS